MAGRTPGGSSRLGGTCLNVGCIPSKALLASSEEYEKASRHLGGPRHRRDGREASTWRRCRRARTQIVTKMTEAGSSFSSGRTRSRGCRASAGSWAAGTPTRSRSAARRCEAKHVIIATGSKARHLPGVAVDNEIVCDNEGALAFGAVPGRLGVIGAGVIGLELGSVWRRLGAEGHDPRGAAGLPRRLRRGGAEGGVEAVHQGAGARHPPGRDDRQGRRAQSRCRGRVLRRQGCRPEARVRPAGGVDRPRAQYRRAGRRGGGTAGSTAAASSRSTRIAVPTCPMSTRSATWCAARCSPTRPRTRA